jgi:uncharacterized protein (TIGR02001 family)
MGGDPAPLLAADRARRSLASNARRRRAGASAVRLVCWQPCRGRAAKGRPVRNSLFLSRCLGILALAGCGTAIADEVHGYLTATSDYVFRGVSLSNEQPTLQAGLDYARTGGFFAGLFAAGIDYPRNPFRPDPGTIELDTYVGYSHAAGRDFTWNVALFDYRFPESEAHDKAYQELGFNLYYRDAARIGATVSDDARNGGASAWTAELELRRPFGGHFQVSGMLGRYTFARSDWHDYLYWDLGLSATTGPWTLDLRYFDTSVEAETFAGPRLTRGRVVASVSIGF